MDQAILEGMNDQLNSELYSSHLYLALAAFFEEKTLPGFAHWMMVQSEEEREHALKFYNHLHDRDQTVALQAIEEPPSEADFSSVSEVFERALAQEQKITESIHNLYYLAQEKNDLRSQTFLDWFVDEQIEEEKILEDLLMDLKRLDGDESMLLILDRELAERQAQA